MSVAEKYMNMQMPCLKINNNSYLRLLSFCGRVNLHLMRLSLLQNLQKACLEYGHI